MLAARAQAHASNGTENGPSDYSMKFRSQTPIFHGMLRRMLGRQEELARLKKRLAEFPVVGILGPRQVGKTTLALAVAGRSRKGVTRFDLENPRDVARLRDEMTALEPLRGLVILDEIQRRPEIFPALRVLADRRGKPARFLVLGSASPDLLKQSSESLAGRIAYLKLEGFGIADVGVENWRKLWLRGGFPRSYLARSEKQSFAWREVLIQTYLQRDLAELELRLPAATLGRFWTMIAHYHGQIWNSSELARSFALSDKTVRRYLDVLEDTFMVRVLPPWSANVGKRLVKSPKVYVNDSGLLHALLDLKTKHDLERHPKLGASFEGFALSEVVRRLRATPRQCFFWATHQGAELDLLVVDGHRRLGFEFKHTNAPEFTKSMTIAVKDLGLESLSVIHVGEDTYPLTDNIRAVSIRRVVKDLRSLS